MRIFMLPNVETEAMADGRLEGLSDSPLTPTGKEQAGALATHLQKEDCDIIHSSPLKRALDTAKLLSQQLTVDVRMFPALKPLCYGRWEQEKTSYLQQEYMWDQRQDDLYNFTHPGTYNGTNGQSHSDIYDRNVEYFEQLSQVAEETVVVITHLSVIRNAKRYFEQCSEDEAASFTMTPRSVYTITTTADETQTAVEQVS